MPFRIPRATPDPDRPPARPRRALLAKAATVGLGLVLVLLVGLFAPLFTPVARAVPAGNRVPWQGGSWYLHGANVPWYSWSCDFGCGASGGVTGNQATLAAGFVRLRDAGVKTARWWVFPGNPWQITRDAAGAPTGVNPAVYADFDAALQLADTYDLYYDFVLFSGPTAVPSAWLTDPTQRARLAAALGPLFARYKDHPRVMTWEVFNEPDWDIWNNRIAKEAVQETVRAIAASVHANSRAYVSVGAAMLDGLPMWTGLGLDYYRAHWYDYMSGGNWCARCTDYATVRARYNLDAPLVIGEFYAGADTDALRRLEDWSAKGYAGADAWSLFSDRTYDRMALDLTAAATFAGRHADVGPRADAAPTPTPMWTATATATATPSPRATATATPTLAATPPPPAPVVQNPSKSIVTSQTSIVISGRAKANALVRVWVDANGDGVKNVGESMGGSRQLSGGGTWYAIRVLLSPNTVNEFIVTATDAAGNESPARDVPSVRQTAR